MKTRILRLLDTPLPNGLIQEALKENAFFTASDIRYAWTAIYSWRMDITEFQQDFRGSEKKKVGIIAAGNIPFAGMHDLICVCLAGFTPIFRPSSRDTVLMKWVLQMLGLSVATNADLTNIDALLASGSTLTTLQLDQMFPDTPRLLRGHRYSVAYLPADFTRNEAGRLASDILRYNGLGCRSISNIIVPDPETASRFLQQLREVPWELSEAFRRLLHWERAIMRVNGESPDHSLPVIPVYQFGVRGMAPGYLAVVTGDTVITVNDVQVVVSRGSGVTFGETQQPGFYDFPDGRNVFTWLSDLNQDKD